MRGDFGAQTLVDGSGGAVGTGAKMRVGGRASRRRLDSETEATVGMAAAEAASIQGSDSFLALPTCTLSF